jgi:hypothetical protein
MPILGIIASSRLTTPPFVPTGSYDALATYTVPAGGVSTITFSGLPTDGQYQHLQIRGITRFAGNDSGFGMWLNNDTTSSNYYSHNLGTSGSGTPYAQALQESFITWSMPNNSTTANVFLGMVVDLLDYSSTSKFKTVRNLHGFDANGSGRMMFSSELWRNTNAVNQITFDSRIQGSTSDFAQFSQFSVYGVK